jgi:3'(2'), 5'-bisphosphate nucleotidase
VDLDLASLWDELERVLLPTLAGFRSRLGSLRVERKSDNTLLSEADLAVQAQIIECVRAIDSDALIVAEESAHLLASLPSSDSGRVWIIDPIDGTAQFVDPDRREFCSVVCLVEDRVPVGAFVLAPELAAGRGPVSVRVTGTGNVIEVNGRPVSGIAATDRLGAASVTRSSGTQPRAYESVLESCGYRLKTRTTSQSLDMVRTCVDLAPFTDPPLGPFGLFYREQQKVWDGVAGMCLAAAAGLTVTDGAGRERRSVEVALNTTSPEFESTLVASDPEAARIVIDALTK